MDLVLLWAGLIGVFIILYVILDGFTLGIALLFPTAANEKERNLLINTTAPVWDANQTWLVLGAGSIFVAFPVLFGVLSSSLYIPLMTFIFGLIFRGVTFEFRSEAGRGGPWNQAFFWGSLVAVVSQGLTLGGILNGITVREGYFAGGPFDWLNPFSVMVGVALVPGYILLGSTFLIVKTSGVVQDRAYRQALWAASAVLIFMAAVTIWTPILYPWVWTHWLSPPRIYFIWAFPLMGLIAFVVLIRSLKARREMVPLLCSVILFLSGYFGLVSSLYPYAIPPSVTLRDAAGQEATLRFMLIGVLIVLPVILAYIAYSYSVFRGKVGREGYY